MDSKGILAIRVKRAYKTYDGRKYVLKGLNMNVPKGNIYGLLGSSGCGKSTLLNAIVNLVGLESGDISTIMESKRDLGFMPQQLALYDRMTTMETLSYFGNVYSMNEREIKERAKYLIGFLEIPNDGREFFHMSGGQKRRLSLAAALIHNPSTLVLDEPTVGVDPILRQSIWDYLLNLAENENKTVVITTHYIEETRQAHMIGLMRSGVLLCEDTPENLLSDNQTESLEEVFMQLSTLQENQKVKDDENDLKIQKFHLEKPTLPEFSKNEVAFNLRRFKAEMMKNFMFMRRDYAVLFYAIMIPLITIVSFNNGVGIEPRPLSVGFFNEEASLGSYSCQNWSPNGTCEFNNLGCRIISKMIDMQITPVLVDSMANGMDLLKKGDIWGLMKIPHNYSQSVEQLTEAQGFGNRESRDVLLEYGMVYVNMDMTSLIVARLLEVELREGVKAVIGEALEECGYSKRNSQPPIKFETPIYTSARSDTRDYIAPTLLSVMVFTMPMAYGVVIILEEKRSGATARSVASGITPFEVIAGHFCIQLLVHFAQSSASMVLLHAIMKFDFKNPPVGTALVLALGLPGILFSFLIPLWLDAMLIAGSVCTAFIIASVLVGGTIWPVEGMHPFLKPISWTLPTYFSTAALRNANFKGWGLDNLSIIAGFASIVVWTVILIGALYGTIVISKNKVFLGKHTN